MPDIEDASPTKEKSTNKHFLNKIISTLFVIQELLMYIESPDIKWCGLSRRPEGYTQTFAQFYPGKQNCKIHK